MPRATARTLRYVSTWLSDRAHLAVEEVELDREGTTIPASLLKPPSQGPWPAWIVLHGVTRPGRNHAQLVRFARAVASAGCAVLVPEVPEWRALDLAPGLTRPTVRAALDALLADPDILGERVGLVGFSFGAPQAATAAADPDIAPHIRGVVGFGGYCDLERTLCFQFTGRHEWEGESYQARPDPYGRWIAGANYLTSIPDYSDMGEVAHALGTLAAAAGDRGLMAWDPSFDEDKEALRGSMQPRHRDIFDLFAPRDGAEPDREHGEEMAHALARAARAVHPCIEPASRLAEIRCPVHLLHGRHDHLIPFSEGLRLAAALPNGIPGAATVTPLFGHSAQDPFPGPIKGLKEGVVFLRALRGIFGLV
jgi:dienelactone hydrolase